MNEILQYLKKHGEKLDSEIAVDTGISLAETHFHLSKLAAKNHIQVCHSIKFVNGKEISAIICRISGYIPPAKPGAKSKKQLTLS